MLAVGDRIPDVDVWLAPHDRVSLRELVADQGTILLLWYLFDWSST